MNQRILNAVINKVIQGNKASYLLQVPKDLCNNFGVVHGGAIHLIYLTLQKDHISHLLPYQPLIPASISIHFLSSIKSSENLEIITNFTRSSDPVLYFSSFSMVLGNKQTAVLGSSIIKSHNS